MDERVRRQLLEVLTDDCGVNCLPVPCPVLRLCIFCVTAVHCDAVRWVLCGQLHVTLRFRIAQGVMKRMLGISHPFSVLRGEHLGVQSNGQDLSFRMVILGVRVSGMASGTPEGSILDSLEHVYARVADDGCPRRTRVL